MVVISAGNRAAAAAAAGAAAAGGAAFGAAAGVARGAAATPRLITDRVSGAVGGLASGCRRTSAGCGAARRALVAAATTNYVQAARETARAPALPTARAAGPFVLAAAALLSVGRLGPAESVRRAYRTALLTLDVSSRPPPPSLRPPRPRPRRPAAPRASAARRR